MYANGATSDNLKVLEQRGVGIIDSDYGELASGLVEKVEWQNLKPLLTT